MKVLIALFAVAMVLSVSIRTGHVSVSLAGRTGATRSVTNGPGDPHVTVFPAQLGKGDWLTVMADHLPPPVDQYCVYFNSPLGPRPLAHFVPPGYGEQISPLIPAEAPGLGIGAYQTWLGVSGTFRLLVASCSYGATPKSVRAVASVPFTIAGAASTSPLGSRAIGATPLGAPFAVFVPQRSQPTCLFIAPEDVFDGIDILPGVPVRSGASSATLTVPATQPWGVYQIFWTASAHGGCPRSQLVAGKVLGSAGWAPGRWKLRMESEGAPSAGSGLAVNLNRAYDSNPHPGPVCVAAWSGGRYTGVAHTFSPAAVQNGDPVHLPLPPSVVGEVTVTGMNRACPVTGPPSHADAYTVTAVAGKVSSPAPAPFPIPVRPSAGTASIPCRAMPRTLSGTVSPARGDPRLVFSTFLGHGASEGTAVAIDQQGNIDVALATADRQGCVVELSPAGDRVLMATELPGLPEAETIDAKGNIWVTGTASGPGFVAKLDPAGKLLFTLYLRGRSGATGQAITTDATGNAYVTGGTFSPDFPTTPGAFQPRYGTTVPGCPPTCTFLSSNPFVMKLTSDGTIVFSTYLGPNTGEGDGIAVDGSGDVFVSGSTGSGFPRVHPLPGARCSSSGRFVTELTPHGEKLRFSSCLPLQGFGGPLALSPGRAALAGSGGLVDLDLTARKVLWSLSIPGRINGIATDSEGRIAIAGTTGVPTFPLVRPLQSHLHVATCGVEEATHTCADAFVAQVSPKGKLLFSTYLGGKADDQANGVAVPAPGQLVVTGDTASSDFPVSRAIQPKGQGAGDQNSYAGGKVDGFLIKIALSPDNL